MSKPEPALFDEIDTEADAVATAEGEADLDAGDLVAHEEVAEWLKGWGTPDEKPAPAKWRR